MAQAVGNDRTRAKKTVTVEKSSRRIIDYMSDPEPYDNTRGEKALWMAVITQAMQDALSNVKNAEAVYHKHEAIRWLTGSSKGFGEVCLMAGVEPSYIRHKAKRTLANPIPWRAEATKGPRYQELKAYKQMRKLKKQAQKAVGTIPHPAIIASVCQPALMAGVWS